MLKALLITQRTRRTTEEDFFRGSLVEFLNSLESVMGNSSYYYTDHATAHQTLRSNITAMEEVIEQILVTHKDLAPGDRNILIEYAEGLGEGRGAIFDAKRISGWFGEVQFSGEGINDLHGLRSQTAALMAAFAKPPPVFPDR
jgi:hypothetical protein